MTENQTRLESWKEIAAYLQRDTTTAQRWEKEEGLPVHRHTHKRRSSVYAYPSEIDDWRAGRKVIPEAAPERPLWRIPAFAVTLLLCLIMVGNGIRPVSAQQARGVQLHQLTAPDLDIYGSFAPDGRSMIITDWNKTGDLAILDITSGKLKRLFAKPASDAGTYNRESSESAESPVLSKDAKQIAYEWCDSRHDHCQFRIMPNRPGAKSRTLAQDPGTDYMAVAWSKDGRRILVNLNRPDKSQQLAWVSTSDGSIAVVKSVGPRRSFAASLSPDDRYILYSMLDVAGFADGSVYVMGEDGRSESVLAKGRQNEVPVWTPDGSYALFSSNRSGSFGLWAIPMQNGQAAGPARLARGDLGKINKLEFSSTGTLFYWQESNQGDVINNVFIADLDPGTGKVRGAPSMLAEAFTGLNVIGALSPDGKSVAILRSRAGGSTMDVVIRSVQAGEEQRFSVQIGLPIGAANIFWASDSRSVLLATREQGKSAVLYRTDLSTATMSVAIQAEIADIMTPIVPSKDLGTIYFTDFRYADNKAADHRALDIFAIDAPTGTRRTVFLSPGTVSDRVLSLSPDGRTLAFLRRSNDSYQLCTVSVDGTGFREIYKPEPATDFLQQRTLSWSHDGRSIFFGLDPTEGAPRLMRISASGGQPEFTGIMGDIHHVYLSADGAHVVFGARGEAKPQFWALDNLIPALKSGR